MRMVRMELTPDDIAIEMADLVSRRRRTPKLTLVLTREAYVESVIKYGDDACGHDPDRVKIIVSDKIPDFNK